MKAKKVNRTILVIGMVLGFGFSFLTLNFATMTASAAEPIVLSMAPSSCPPPPAEGQTLVFTNQMKLLEERTNGRLKVEIYWGQSLAKARDLVTAGQTGIADIVKVNPHYEPGKLPLSGVAHQPGIGTHMWSRARAYWDMMNEEPIKSEIEQYNLHSIGLALITDLGMLTNKPVKTIDDIKGNKFAAGGAVGELIKSLGGVPIHMSPGEEYDLLKKGMTRGICAPYGAIFDFKFYEAGKYFTSFKLGSRIGGVAINGDTWKKLPADIRKIIDDSWLDMINIAYEDFIATDEKAIKTMKENGVEFFDPDPSAVAKVLQIQAGMADKWAESLEAKGLPAKEVLARYTELVEKYDKVNPYK